MEFTDLIRNAGIKSPSFEEVHKAVKRFAPTDGKYKKFIREQEELYGTKHLNRFLEYKDQSRKPRWSDFPNEPESRGPYKRAQKLYVTNLANGDMDEYMHLSEKQIRKSIKFDGRTKKQKRRGDPFKQLGDPDNTNNYFQDADRGIGEDWNYTNYYYGK